MLLTKTSPLFPRITLHPVSSHPWVLPPRGAPTHGCCTQQNPTNPASVTPFTNFSMHGVKNKSPGDLERGGDTQGDQCQRRGVCVCPPPGAAGAATLPQLPRALKNNNQRGKKQQHSAKKFRRLKQIQQ